MEHIHGQDRFSTAVQVEGQRGLLRGAALLYGAFAVAGIFKPHAALHGRNAARIILGGVVLKDIARSAVDGRYGDNDRHYRCDCRDEQDQPFFPGQPSARPAERLLCRRCCALGYRRLFRLSVRIQIQFHDGTSLVFNVFSHFFRCYRSSCPSASCPAVISRPAESVPSSVRNRYTLKKPRNSPIMT